MIVEKGENQTVEDCRAELKAALENDAFRVLVMAGPVGSRAAALHAAMVANEAEEGGGWRADQKYAWIPDVSVLTEDECKRWFGNVWANPLDCYAMLDQGPADKPVLLNGRIHELIRSDDRIRFSKLRGLFEGTLFMNAGLS